MSPHFSQNTSRVLAIFGEIAWPAWQAFLWGSGAKNCSAKMERVKEGGGGGEERKETLADKPLDFENRPHAQ